jgi:hypothetical protein
MAVTTYLERVSPQSGNHKFAQFLQQQHCQRERQYKQPYFRRNRLGAEDHVAPIGIVDSQYQNNLQRDTPEYDAIIEQAGTEHTAPRRFAEKYIDDLRNDDGAQASRGGLKI